MGRINQTWAYDQKYVRKYGKLYGSIDVTFQELDQIQRTLQAAKEVVNKRYKLGFMR